MFCILPHAMLRNPTIHAVMAPERDKDFRLTPCAAIRDAMTAPRLTLVGLNGFISR